MCFGPLRLLSALFLYINLFDRIYSLHRIQRYQKVYKKNIKHIYQNNLILLRSNLRLIRLRLDIKNFTLNVGKTEC